MGKPFTNINKEQAIDFRSRLEGLEANEGYQLMKVYFEKTAQELRSNVMPIPNDDFATLNLHNKRIYKAEAFEEVLQWLQDAKAQCDGVIERGGK